MKHTSLLLRTILFPLTLTLTLTLVFAGCSKSAAPTTTTAVVPLKGELVEATAKDADWVAKQTAIYPLTTCTVSGDKLGTMGKPLTYIWKEAGKPDRLILFCCSDCPPDFKKDPAKYLSMIK